MSMDSTRWRTGDFDLMKFFLEATAIAGWQFEPSDQNGRESKIGLLLNGDRVLTSDVELAPSPERIVEQNAFQKERDVAKSGFCSTINRETFRPLKFAIDKRKIELEGKPIADVVTADELRDRTVFVLADRICYFATVNLKGAEISKLLGD